MSGFYTVGMSPSLDGIQHFERSDMVDIRNGIMFVFYLGLPHVYIHL